MNNSCLREAAVSRQQKPKKDLLNYTKKDNVKRKLLYFFDYECGFYGKLRYNINGIFFGGVSIYAPPTTIRYCSFINYFYLKKEVLYGKGKNS